MESLESLRGEIDLIDAELTALFEKRMEVVRRVGAYKRAHAVGIYDGSRERDVIEKNAARLKNPGYQEALARFFGTLTELGRELQEQGARPGGIALPAFDLRFRDGGPVGYQGTAGSFSEEALVSFFGEDRQARAYDDFEDVFRALFRGDISFGVLPIENSSTGGIAQVYDLLNKYDFYICGEKYLKIDHHLVGVPGARLEDITEVYSHPQGFEQSADFFDAHRAWKLIPHYNTAVSAKMVSLSGSPRMAAVASRRAAGLYGLSILWQNINSQKGNTTRFVIVGRAFESVPDSDKASVVFSLDDRAGTLYRLLRYFSEHGVNMTKIESRPMKNSPWTYLLYVDFECRIQDGGVGKALWSIKEHSAYFRLLGFYKKETL